MSAQQSIKNNIAKKKKKNLGKNMQEKKTKVSQTTGFSTRINICTEH